MTTLLPFRTIVVAACLVLATVSGIAQSGKALAASKAMQQYDVVPNTVLVRLKPGATTLGLATSVLGANEVYASRQILLDKQSVTYNSALRRNLGPLSTRTMQIIQAEEPLLRTFVLKYTGDEDPYTFAQKLVKTNPAVEIAEPSYIPRMMGTPPNDPMLAQQQMLDVIKALEAWDVYGGDASMVIAISDDGMDQIHEDLANSIWTNEGEIPDNNIDDDNNGYIDDYRGYNLAAEDDSRAWGDTYNTRTHGTSVAGILGATPNNALGIAGVAGKCKIFPLKIAPFGTQSLSYGYESIIYAAVNGFKVINCSWGIDNYSDINQSIIDFAVSRDVAIVAAAGNDGDSRLIFPAAYNGVMGVGNSWPDDVLVGNSAYGAHLDIVAPGEGTITTSNSNVYTSFGGTSGATPIVSGTLALVRALHPELTNLQAMEFLRRCTDNIEAKNPSDLQKGLIPGRINMLKAVTLNPFGKPSISLVDHEMTTDGGKETNRFAIEETIHLSLTVVNQLRSADGFLFRLSVVSDPQQSLQVLTNEVEVPPVASGQIVTVEGLTLKKNIDFDGTVFLRVDIFGDPDYQDYFLIPFRPSVNFTSFSNDSLTFAMVDGGQVGFPFRMQYPGDVGIRLNSFGNFLYEGGIMACANNERVVSATRSHLYNGVEQTTEVDHDFSVVKPFINPDRTVGIIRDNAAAEPIGLDIRQEVMLPEGGSRLASIQVTAKNISGTTLNDVSIGYFLDWDIGRYGEDNRIRLDYNGSTATGGSIVWGVASRPGDYPFVGCGAYSMTPGAIAQFASFENYSTSPDNPFRTSIGFMKSDKILSLTLGTAVHYDGAGDIGCVTGMRFPGEWPADEERTFVFLLGADWTAAGLKQSFESILPTVGVDEQLQVASGTPVVYPQPARDAFTVSGNTSGAVSVSLSVVNALGVTVVPARSVATEAGAFQTVIDARTLPPGVYFVRVGERGIIRSVPFVIVK